MKSLTLDSVAKLQARARNNDSYVSVWVAPSKNNKQCIIEEIPFEINLHNGHDPAFVREGHLTNNFYYLVNTHFKFFENYWHAWAYHNFEVADA